MSTLPPKADIPGGDHHVCFVPEADIVAPKTDCQTIVFGSSLRGERLAGAMLATKK